LGNAHWSLTQVWLDASHRYAVFPFWVVKSAASARIYGLSKALDAAGVRETLRLEDLGLERNWSPHWETPVKEESGAVDIPARTRPQLVATQGEQPKAVTVTVSQGTLWAPAPTSTTHERVRP
jgi:hypothetical protein